MHHSWRTLKFWKHTYPKVKEELESVEKTVLVLPRKEDRFKALSIPFKEVKVVILGQDPYHTKGLAHGLSFSVLPHHRKLPPSLRNIFDEYQADLGFPRPRSGDLRDWHRRGVLLLNSSLTVEENKPNSQQHLWSKLTYEILSRLSHRRDGIVFMLWGHKANEYKALIDQSRHLVLSAGHPSPFSVRLFRGCRHFSKAAEYLKLKPDFWKLQ